MELWTDARPISRARADSPGEAPGDAVTRAARGAAMLDAESPGWAGRIDLKWLDMHDCRLCVLGQLHGGFGLGVAALGLQGRLAEHGFRADLVVWWDDLLAAWLAEIEVRVGPRHEGTPR